MDVVFRTASRTISDSEARPSESGAFECENRPLNERSKHDYLDNSKIRLCSAPE